MKTTQEWKGIEWLDKYKVSSSGDIMSFHNSKERLKAVIPIRSGYYTVNLSYLGSCKTFYIHRLVAQAFIPNPENKETVNHIDGDKSNNCVSNLEWMTRSENSKHGYDNGLIKMPWQLTNEKE